MCHEHGLRSASMTRLRANQQPTTSEPKVLLLIEGGADPGPIPQFAQLLRNAGIDIVVATIRGTSGMHEEVSALGIPALAFGARTSNDYPAVCVRIARTISHQRIDVIHGVEPIAATLGNIASILTRQSKRLFDRNHNAAPWPRNFLSYVASHSAHLVRVPSKAAGSYAVREDRLSSRKVRVVLNTAFRPLVVSLDEARRLRVRLGIPEDAAIISTVARLRHEKGLHVALQALPIVAAASARPVHYVVAGDGPCLVGLRSLAARLHAPVHFVGHQQTVAPWFVMADVVWMPSLSESLGISAVEAMACGRPVVASAVDGLREVVAPGETGLLVPPENPAALARATLSLLTSPEQRVAFGRAGRLRYERLFTPQQAIEGIIRCYSELLERPLG
jgi:glycosyltransferase involved in cell wall biosynthesis